jgi:mannose-6-phosphate isomerase
MAGIYTLKGGIKHYDWGGFSFIPSLLKIVNAEARPFAEYWLGIHPLGSSDIELAGRPVLLKEYLDEHSYLLGKSVREKFGHLPFLLKVLDVRNMLSIQVHPSQSAAETGFNEENEKGVPLDSPKRNYKDKNHKPELIVALGEFWLLHGFKPVESLVTTLQRTPELKSLLTVFGRNGYENLYKWVMTLPQEEADELLQPLVKRILPLYKAGKLDRSQEDYWAAKAALSFPRQGKIDRGIFSIYLFNLVKLNRGEAIFQDAGVPHAYLEGQNVEIMANSDNVLRGGLTTKHIDVPELLKHVKCEATAVHILQGDAINEGEKIYRTSSPDFQLSVFELKAGQSISFSPVTAEILLVTDGEVIADNSSVKVKLHAGKPSGIVFPGQSIHLHTPTEATVYRASVPIHTGE